MENNIVLRILMSMVFFLPFLLAFTGFVLIGALVAYEALASFFAKQAEEVLPLAESHGPIATALAESIAEEADLKQDKISAKK